MIGDSADFQARLKRLLPTGWLSTDAPIANAVIGGLADGLAQIYGLITYLIAQTRIATATGLWLDLIAVDFFGSRLARATGETDTSLRTRIKRELLRERVTRAGMVAVLTDLTGSPPTIFEPWNTADTGGLDYAMGFDVAGALGSLDYTAQCFIDVTRPKGNGIPNVVGMLADGSAGATGGFDVGAAELADIASTKPPVSDQDIYDAINATRPVGVICWTRLH